MEKCKWLEYLENMKVSSTALEVFMGKTAYNEARDRYLKEREAVSIQGTPTPKNGIVYRLLVFGG